MWRGLMLVLLVVALLPCAWAGPMKPVDAAIEVTVGPLVDDTDFKSLETAIAYNAAGMSVDVFIETAAGVTKYDVTPTTSGDYDWTHEGNGIYSLEIPASGGASANNDTEGILWVVGVCTGVLPFESPRYLVVPATVYNSWVAGSDTLPVDMTQIGGAAQSATDLKDFADTGYDPSAHKVQGVVLVDTTTTNTDMRGTDSASTFNAASDKVYLGDGAHGGSSATLTLSDYSDFTGGGGGDATAENQATIIAALTAIEGSTFDTDTDSLEAIRDRGDAAWTSTSGSGEDSVTVTVKSGETAIPGAMVGVSPNADGTEAFWGVTDSLGQCEFRLTDGETYYKYVRASGYTTVQWESFVAEKD